MSTAPIRAGSAFVEIFLKDGKLQAGLRGAQQKLQRFAANMQQVGWEAIRAGVVGALPFAAATRVFMGFSDQMQELRAVTGATSVEFEKLNDQAKQLGRTTSFKASEVAGGMTELGRAGFSPTEVQAAIPHVLNLARATRTDLAEAATIAAGTMRQFRMEAKQMPAIADLLVATANSSAQTLTDLGESMQYVAPLAASTGATLKDTAASLAILANNGIKGSRAGTALARAYKNLSQEAQQVQLERWGVSIKDSNNNMRLMAHILADIGSSMSGLGSADRLGALNTLFGRGTAAAEILSSSTKDAIQQLQLLSDVQGEAAKTAATMDSALGGAFRMLMSAIESVGVAIGEAIAVPLGQAFAQIQSLAKGFAEWIEQNKETARALARTAIALVSFGTAAVALTLAVKILGTVLGVLSGTVLFAGKVFGMLKAAAVGLVYVASAAKAFGLASTAASVGTIALGTAADGAAAGVTGLGAALAFVTAHPIVALLTAAAVAVGAWMLINNQLVQSIRAVTSSLFLFEKQSSKTASQVNSGHQAMVQKVKRLEELRQQQSMTNEEMAEARDLVLDLTAAYPRLTSEIKALGTGASNTAGMFAEMNRLKEDALKLAAKRDIFETEKDLRALLEREKKEAKAVTDASLSDPHRLGQPFAPSMLLDNKGASPEQLRKLQETREEIELLTEKARIAREKLTLLNEPIKDVAGGGGYRGRSSGEGPAPESMEAAAKAEAALNRRLAQLHIARWADEEKRALATIDERYHHERNEAKKLGRDLTKLDRAHAMESDNTRREFAARRAKDEERDAVRRDAEESSLEHQIRRLQIENQFDGPEEKQHLAAREMLRELEEAAGSGVDPALIRKKYKLIFEGLAADAEEASRKQSFSSAGTFSAHGVRGLSGNDVQLRTAVAAEGTLEAVDEINERGKNEPGPRFE